jgi:hypothetical protein
MISPSSILMLPEGIGSSALAVGGDIPTTEDANTIIKVMAITILMQRLWFTIHLDSTYELA